MCLVLDTNVVVLGLLILRPKHRFFWCPHKAPWGRRAGELSTCVNRLDWHPATTGRQFEGRHWSKVGRKYSHALL